MEAQRTVPRTSALVALALALSVLAAPAMAALPGGVPGVSGAPWGAWLTETVDAGDISGSVATSIALVANGAPHVAYGADGPNGYGAVWHAQPSGATGWSLSMVEERARAPSVALNATGAPHVSYGGGPWGNDLTYARLVNGAWQTETVDKDGSTRDTTLRFDADGDPHIAYGARKSGQVDVRYATKTTTGWQTETVTVGSAPWMDFDLDANETPHISFERHDNTGGGVLYYATKNASGGWLVEKVLPGCGLDNSIAVGPDGRPHVACHWATKGLGYAHRTATGWVVELASDGSNAVPPRTGSDTGWDTDIAVDANGTPHITYNTRIPPLPDDPTRPAQLHYATKTNGEWLVETVDRDGQLNGDGSNIALDAQGRPHVSYIIPWRLYAHPPAEDAIDASFDLRYARPAAALLGAVGE